MPLAGDMRTELCYGDIFIEQSELRKCVLF